MASTPTSSGRIQLMANGENSNEWGDITNENLQTLDRMIGGYHEVAATGASVTLSSVDYSLGDWHNFYFKVTGTLENNFELIVPSYEKNFVVENATTGDFTLTVTTLLGTGTAVPRGQRALLVNDGEDVYGVVLQPYSANLGGIAAIAAAGIPARATDGSWAGRTMTGTEDQITVVNGNGGAGNPTFSFSAQAKFPGTLQSQGTFTVATGGIVVQTGGVTVQAGGFRITGANAVGTVASTSGFGSIEVSGPAGGTIDLKNSESEDFDIRLFTSGTGGWVISNNALNLQTLDTGQVIQSLIGQEVVTATTLNQFAVLKGDLRVQVTGNNDAKIQFANQLRTWDVGARGGGGFSIRNNGIDGLIIATDGGVTLTSGLAIQGSGLSVVGNVTATGGGVNFSAMTSFSSKGITDDASGGVLWVRGSQNVGINSSIPQQMLHMGSLGSTKNATIRVETGGPAGFRGWDFGTNYNDFSFFINDATGGVRRFAIGLDGRTQVTAGFTVTAGTTLLNGGLTVSGTSALNGSTTISKSGSGNTLAIINPANTGNDGCQVQYNGQAFNVFTRVVQSNGNFEFLNTNYNTITFAVTQAGSCFNATGTYGTLSDIRLKEFVDNARDRTDDLLSLRVVDYALKNDERTEADRVGFIAQEVEEVFPEFVIQAGDFGGVDNALAVSTSNMTPLIVQALQNFNRRLKVLENAQ